MLPERLLQLKEKITSMGVLVEKMLKKSMEGLIEKNKEKLNKVIKKDEPETNQMEIDIDELCISTIALFQPEAKDLRTVLMILKMNNDLERMGDLAVNISQSAFYLIERPEINNFAAIIKMGEETIKMIKNSIDSFVKEDIKLAKKVCEKDDVIDNLAYKILENFIKLMKDKQIIKRSLHILRIAKNLERIADLSTNIAEDIIFMAKGKVIKHKHE